MKRSGNALALALMVLVVAMVLASALLGSTGMGANLAILKMHRNQARYLAESALRIEAWRISAPVPDTTIPSFLTGMTGIEYPVILIDSSDIWIHLEASAAYRDQAATAAADLGKPQNPLVFRYALRVLEPIEPALQSNIRAVGQILIASNQTMPVNPTSGQILDQSQKAPERLWALWSTRLAGLFHPDSMRNCGESCYSGNQRIRNLADLQYPVVRIQNGDLHVEMDGQESLTGAHLLAAQGDLEIDGEWNVDTLYLLSKGTIRIKGALHARRLVAFAEGAIIMEGEHRLEARLIAQGDIRISGSTVFLPWSLLATAHSTGNLESGRGDIRIEGKSIVSGYVICASASKFTAPPEFTGPVGVFIDRDAVVKGAVFSTSMLRNEGRIHGIATVRRLGCASSPEINCPGAGEYLRDSLPVGFLQIPDLSFNESSRLSVVKWSVQ